MERSKHTLWFWVLVIAAVIMPTSGDARTKQLHKADIANGSTGVGSSVITVQPSGYSYIARTFALPGGVVQKASLVADDGSTWEVVLCENGGLAGDCIYNATGNLDIEGAINAPMLGLAGITGGTFNTALRNGRLWIRLDDGGNGTGRYVRII